MVKEGSVDRELDGELRYLVVLRYHGMDRQPIEMSGECWMLGEGLESFVQCCSGILDVDDDEDEEDTGNDI